MAGDPDLETTRLVLSALSEAGADAIELGVPYSDPLADGPVIAAAGMRALQNGVGLDDVLKTVASGKFAPVILFSYYNPIYQYGVQRFADAAARAGVAGAIVPDVALEEAEQLRTALREKNLIMPLLVAPSTPHERARAIAREATGFVYVVSRLGVTGQLTADTAAVREHLAQLRSITGKPLAVGFGIRSADQVRSLNGAADGIIVGTAMIQSYDGHKGAEAAGKAASFLRSLAREGRQV